MMGLVWAIDLFLGGMHVLLTFDDGGKGAVYIADRSPSLAGEDTVWSLYPASCKRRS